MIDAIFNPTTRLLEKAMSLRMMRHGILASNIANAETPNYRAIDVDFRATMRKLIERVQHGPKMELQRTDERHLTAEGLSGSQSEAERQRIVFSAADGAFVGNDSNSADLEVELGKAQENAMLYSVTAQLLAKKMKALSGLIESVSRV